MHMERNSSITIVNSLEGLLFYLFSNHKDEMAFHTRSNSFPSRPHPIVEEVYELLCRLRSSESTSTSSSISHKLSNLKDLHDCVEKLLQLPLTQQSLAQEQNEKWTNELLDGSVRLLDVCATVKDTLSQTKECVQDLQSIIRRRGGESALTSEVTKYLTSRKMVKKAIHKAMVNLKGMKNRSAFSSPNKDEETIAIVSKLRDVEAVTREVFESLMSFISGPKSRSLVSKMMQSKKAACEIETEVNEFSQVDAALHKSADNAQNQLEKLESCIQDQEEGLECLFRQLIKIRVSLLNILNH
ncbi:uncharacterized protein LOC125480732 [Pyrus x bretschneideri]|uniref:uncharacterized protein LOC125480732 n=1 Tax=Pyrus x bretschneideri TaxID=225117 RepID=UPI00202DF013|nr:uncharacterized protein LOC125480732 [Pyrus x bretschneideri]